MSSGAVTGSTAILYRMPSGTAGDITRKGSFSAVVTGFFHASYLPTAFGVPVKMVSGLLRMLPASAAATDIYGILARTAPQIGTTPDANGNSTGITAALEQAIMKKGFMNVLCTIGTPARGGKVFCRVVADTGKAVGDLEATMDKTVANGAIHGTGTGTIACTVATGCKAGTWTLTLQSTSQTAKVTVIDPDGVRWADATVGSAYSQGGLSFTISAAGTMTSGDYFIPVVTDNNVVVPGAEWAVDGCDANYNTEIFIG